MTAEKRKRSDYAKMLKQYPDVLRIEQMCEALGGTHRAYTSSGSIADSFVAYSDEVTY